MSVAEAEALSHMTSWIGNMNLEGYSNVSKNQYTCLQEKASKWASALEREPAAKV